MATIKTLVYGIWKELDALTPTDDSRYTYRQIKEVVTGAIADALKRDFYEQRNADEFIYGNANYTATYKNIPVQTDTNGLKYVEIPAKTISIPGGRDIDIHPSNHVSLWAKEFIPVRREEVFLGKLQNNVPCVILYYKEDGKAYFFNGVVDDTSLNVTMYYSIPEDDEAEINMPEEFKNLIIQTGVQTLAPQIRPADHNNDGTEV